MINEEYLKLKKDKLTAKFNETEELLNEVRKEKDALIDIYEVELARIQGEYRMIVEMEEDLAEKQEDAKEEVQYVTE